MIAIESARRFKVCEDDVAASIRENFRANLTRILDARLKSEGVTQEAWAKARELSSNRLSKWKNGLAFPRNFNEIDELANHLGVTSDELIEGTVTVRSRDLDAILKELADYRGFVLRPKEP